MSKSKLLELFDVLRAEKMHYCTSPTQIYFSFPLGGLLDRAKEKMTKEEVIHQLLDCLKSEELAVGAIDVTGTLVRFGPSQFFQIFGEAVASLGPELGLDAASQLVRVIDLRHAKQTVANN